MNRTPSPVAARLAERYGMTPEAIEEILRSAGGEYSGSGETTSPETPSTRPESTSSNAGTAAALGTGAAAALMANSASGETRGAETSAERTGSEAGSGQTKTLPAAATEENIPVATTTHAASFTEQPKGTPDRTHPEPGKVPPIRDNRTAPPSQPTAVPPAGNRPPSGLSGGALATILGVLAIGLVLALSLEKGCFRQRNSPGTAASPDYNDSIQKQLTEQAQRASTPPVAPDDTINPPKVPPEALLVPREEPPGTSGPPSYRGPTTTKEAVQASKKPVPHGTKATRVHSAPKHTTARSTGPKVLLNTTSELAAEERLAEQHANGNTRARIKTTRKNGITHYQVVTR